MALEGHAELALMDERPELAAQLLGAADAWRAKQTKFVAKRPK